MLHLLTECRRRQRRARSGKYRISGSSGAAGIASMESEQPSWLSGHEGAFREISHQPPAPHPRIEALRPTGAGAGAAGSCARHDGHRRIPANAVGGYHTAGSGCASELRATTGSAQTASILRLEPPLDIACQIGGENLSAAGWGTSPVWDKLNGYGGGYISDLFVRETLTPSSIHASPCDAPARWPREIKAINWANAQLGRTSDEWGAPISGWCARWSVGAYGRQNAGYASAAAMYNAFRNAGMIHGGTAPAGTFVFAAARVNGTPATSRSPTVPAA